MAVATVVISTEHPSYREGLARAITAHPGLELLAVAADAVSARREIVVGRPDICLLDVALRPSGGLELCRCIRQDVPDLRTRFVLMSSTGGASLADEARAAGASLVLAKDTPRARLCELLVELARERPA